MISSSDAPLGTPPNPRVCQFYRKGKCKRGSRCKYLHIDETPDSSETAPRLTHTSLSADARPFKPKNGVLPRSSRPISHSAGSRSRKQKKKELTFSANYLLNFSYRPVIQETPSSYASDGANRKRGSRRPSKYKKHRFVQANYRFGLCNDPEQLSRVDLSSPDKPVDWAQVQYIEYASSESTSCPICLEVPVAPLTTKCGHIYCTHCFLRHMSMSDRCRCPICFADVFETDLKPVSMRPVSMSSPGDRIKFTLMRRQKGCIIPLPRARWRNIDGIIPVVNPDSKFSRYFVASEIESVLQEEEAALREAAELARSCGDESSLPFISMAQERCSNRRAIFYASRTECSPSTPTALADAFSPHNEKHHRSSIATMNSKELNHAPMDKAGMVDIDGNSTRAHLDKVGDIDGDVRATGDDDTTTTHSTSTTTSIPSEDSESFYFYQEESGLNVILSPFDMKVLKCEYAEYSAFPDEIEVQMLSLNPVPFDESIRKRYYKMIGHFALATPLSFCEADVSCMISEKTQNKVNRMFADECSRRMAIKASLELMHAEKNALEEETKVDTSVVGQGAEGDTSTLDTDTSSVEHISDGGGGGGGGKDAPGAMDQVGEHPAQDNHRRRRRRRSRKSRGKAVQRGAPPSFASVAKNTAPSMMGSSKGNKKVIVLSTSSAYRR